MPYNPRSRLMVFKSFRDSLVAAALTWAFSMSACWVFQDHPVYIPRGRATCDRKLSADVISGSSGRGGLHRQARAASSFSLRRIVNLQPECLIARSPTRPVAASSPEKNPDHPYRLTL